MKMKNLFSALMAAVVMMAVIFLGYGDSFAKQRMESPPGIHQLLLQNETAPTVFTAIADNAPIVQPIIMAEHGVGYLIEGQVQADVALLRSERSNRYAYNYKTKSKSEIRSLYKREFGAMNQFVPRLT